MTWERTGGFPWLLHNLQAFQKFPCVLVVGQRGEEKSEGLVRLPRAGTLRLEAEAGHWYQYVTPKQAGAVTPVGGSVRTEADNRDNQATVLQPKPARSGKREPPNHTPICCEPFWSEGGKRKMLNTQAFGSKRRHMEGIELAWKRQVTLEETEIWLHHKLGGISTPYPHSRPFHQAAWSQEQGLSLQQGLPIFFTSRHTENDDAGVEHWGKQTGRLASGLPSCPAALSVDSFNIYAPPTTHSCAQNISEKSHIPRKEPMCFSVRISNYIKL